VKVLDSVMKLQALQFGLVQRVQPRRFLGRRGAELCVVVGLGGSRGGAE